MLSTIDREAARRFLARGCWFGRLPLDLQRAIVDSSERRTFSPRQMVYAAGEPGRGLWMLLQGQVAIANTSANGGQFLFHIAGPGHCFGIASAMTRQPTTFEATATTRAQLLLLPVAELKRLLRGTPDHYDCFDDLLVMRYRTSLSCLADSRTLAPDAYLRARLAQLAELWREDGYDETTIELALSQSDVARLLGISRQTANRYLAQMEAEGLVEVGFCSLRILSRTETEASAESGAL